MNRLRVAYPKWFRLLLFLGFILVGDYSFACLLLFFCQNHLIFAPDRVVYKTPASFKLHYQDVWLPVSTSSGRVERMHGWWIPANKPNQKTLLYLHGKGANGGAVNQAYHFHQLGFSVLLINYRGYGLSEGGFPTEASVYEDAQIAWNYLIKK